MVIGRRVLSRSMEADDDSRENGVCSPALTRVSGLDASLAPISPERKAHSLAASRAHASLSKRATVVAVGGRASGATGTTDGGVTCVCDAVWGIKHVRLTEVRV